MASKKSSTFTYSTVGSLSSSSLRVLAATLLLWLRIFGAAGGQIFGFSISVVATAARRGHSTVSFSNNKTLLENVRTAT